MSFINLHIDLYTQTRHKMTVTVPDFLSQALTHREKYKTARPLKLGQRAADTDM